MGNGAHIEYDETMNRQRIRNQYGRGVKQGAKGRTNVKRELVIKISDNKNVRIFAPFILHLSYFAQYCDHVGCQIISFIS